MANDKISSRTHVVYSCNVELEDGTIKPGVRITVPNGANAEQEVRDKIKSRFKNSKIRSIGKAMNPSENDNDSDELRWQDNDGDGKWYEPGVDVDVNESYLITKGGEEALRRIPLMERIRKNFIGNK